MTDWKDPIHPGEVLAGELGEIGLEASQLARTIGIPKEQIDQLLQGQQNMTADIAQRLGDYFNTGAQFWLNLQTAYEQDLVIVQQEILNRSLW